ncbi:MAG: tetratricopeptide repeat protein [Melioribacteraceae bacterium]|nr:tetratricopeptide repeat protein [Melioribacteraceae bacterium]
MKKIIIISLLNLILYSCSKEVIKTNEQEKSEINIDIKKVAQELFIDASILEAQGDVNNAIEKYIQANRIDPQAGISFTIAKNYFKQNKLSSALNYANEAVKLSPKNIEYLSLLAAIYNASNFKDSSTSVYEKIISIDSTNVNALFNLAENYESNRPKEAINIYKKIIQQIGPEWNVLVRLVDLNDRLGNSEETIKYFEELVSLNPADLNLQKILIDVYLKSKNYDKAIKKVDEALISFPDDLNLIEYKAMAYAQKGDLKSSSQEYIKLVKNKEIPFDRKINVGLSFLLQAQKDSTSIDFAKTIFEILDKDSTDWEVKAYLGEIAIRKKQDSIAINYFKEATKLAEWNAQVWIRLGGLLFDAHLYDDAIYFMQQAVEKFPNDFVINLIYGLSLSQNKEHQKAVEILRRALKINANDLTALSAIGYSLNQIKQDDEALFYLSKALNLDPNNLQIISIKALIHENRKEYLISDSLYIKALNIDSTNVLILNNLAYSYAERGIKLDEALKMSKKSVDAEPNNASYLDTYGWIHFKLGNYNVAKEYLEKAINIEKENATLIDHLGDVYFKLGDRKKSKELWEKAFELDHTKTEIQNKIQKGEL